MPDRNQKLTFDDIEAYLNDNKIELGLKFLGKRRTEPAIMIKSGRAQTPLARELTEPLFEAIVRVMVANGMHAKKNERPLET